MRKINTRSFVLATRGTPREVNRQILLNLVRENEPICRADLARRMEIARGMVTSLVNELLTEGMLYQGATVDSPRGRRPQMLYVHTRGHLVVSVDVRFSRTIVRFGDISGTSIGSVVFETAVDPPEFVARLARHVRQLLAAHDDAGEILGLGLVLPGIVDCETGRVLNSPHLGWRNIDVRDALSAALGIPVFVENAPIASALAHMWLSQRGGSEENDFVYLSVADGVGTGVVWNGQVMRGTRNSAGEFGHVPLSTDGPRCHCGGRGCLEAYVSDLATVIRYLGEEFSPETARPIVDASGVTVEEVVRRANIGEARAVAAVQATGRYLGAGLAVIVNALSPAKICVGGNIVGAWHLMEPIVTATIRERALTDIAAATPIIHERGGAEARLRGATALVAAPRYAAPSIA